MDQLKAVAGRKGEKQEGEAMELRVLTQQADTGCSASGLSVNLLEAHNKSMQHLAKGEADKEDKVSSWLERQTVTTKPNTTLSVAGTPQTNQRAQGPRLVPKSMNGPGPAMPSLPTLMVESPEETCSPKIVVAGDDIMQSRGSGARLAIVQSMMSVDSDGNILPPVMMSRSGRYQAMGNNTAAFQHINIQDIVNINEQESMLRESHTSMTSNKMLQITHQLKRASVITKAASRSFFRFDPQEQEGDGLEEGAVKDDIEADVDKNELADSETTQSTIVLTESEVPTPTKKAFPGAGLLGSIFSKPGTDQASKKGSSGFAIMMANKWKSKIRRTADTKNTAFTRQLEWHTNKVIEELPMSLKIEVYKEAYPIAVETVGAYERSLGKGHYMTKESKEQLEKLTGHYEEVLNL